MTHWTFDKYTKFLCIQFTYLQACCTSASVKLSTPSFCIILSSAARDRSFIRSWNRRKLLVPNVCTSSTRQRAINWLRDKESRVISSSNSFENFMISSVETCSPKKNKMTEISNYTSLII